MTLFNPAQPQLLTQLFPLKAISFDVQRSILNTILEARPGDHSSRCCLALLRSGPDDMRKLVGGLTPFQLEKIGVQTDMNTAVPKETLEALRPIAFNDDGTLSGFAQHVIAASPYATVRDLQVLSQDSNSKTVKAVVCHPHTPPETIKALAQDSNTDVKIAVAENPNTPSETLNTLAQEEADQGIKISVAGNPSTPLRTFLTLAKDSNIGVKISITTRMQSLMRSIHTTRLIQ